MNHLRVVLTTSSFYHSLGYLVNYSLVPFSFLFLPHSFSSISGVGKVSVVASKYLNYGTGRLFYAVSYVSVPAYLRTNRKNNILLCIRFSHHLAASGLRSHGSYTYHSYRFLWGASIDLLEPSQYCLEVLCLHALLTRVSMVSYFGTIYLLVCVLWILENILVNLEYPFC